MSHGGGGRWREEIAAGKIQRKQELGEGVG